MSAAFWKLAGAALLTAAGAMLGRGLLDPARRRAALLRSLAAGLGRLADGLSLLRPLPQILAGLAGRPFFPELAEPCAAGELERAWRAAALALPLGREEREALAELGSVLGRYAADRQTGELEHVRARLDAAAEAAEASLRNRSRPSVGLGAAAGAMLAVLLV